ncbi:hypothetical protein NLU13_5610 [Sarocladium strictum]|uniref:Zn(2)-C6 fungal-type domain-containing protein n=1 Tax=Sarocladium strictum TaxID=5046 RepID=A0AA39GJQ6_SARSR|nr:hypothetical protein NLU13_5610 [Sarocladium strictum]
MPADDGETPAEEVNASSGLGAAATGSQKERQRVTKACDHCNQIRTKCDGVSPCSRCIAYQVACTFDRKSRRNGRKKRRATPPLLGRHPWPRPGAVVPSESDLTSAGITASAGAVNPSEEDGEVTLSQPGQPIAGDSIQGTLPTGLVNSRPLLNIPVPQTPAEPGQRGGFDASYGYEQQLFGHLDGSGVSALPPYLDEYINPAWQGFSNEAHAACPDKSLFGGQTPAYSGVRSGHGFPRSDVGGLGGLNSRTPRSERSGAQTIREAVDVEYPVIIPLLPFCSHQISPPLACKLLEGYFSTFSDHDAYASSPFIITHVLRKQSFLSPTSFRDCKPALLSSMLLVAAQTVEMPFFGSAPTARHRLCQGLFELTVTLLSSNPPASRSPHGATTGEKTVIAQERRLVGSSQSLSVLAATRTIDDVIAYMHLAVISSAAESKSVGSHWWHTAVQLAKELKLNLELPSSAREPRSTSRGDAQQADNALIGTARSRLLQDTRVHQPVASSTTGADSTSPIGMVDNTITEDDGTAHVRAGFEDQEERRRVWWCLYVLDRHLAICYNSPLAIRDTDCQDLLWPLDDASWQAGAYWSDAAPGRRASHADLPGTAAMAGSSLVDRPKGSSAECIGPGIFGLFIPFAFILGQIIDARQLMSQPHYRTLRAKEIGHILQQEINGQLETFKATLDRLAIPSRGKDWDMTGQPQTGTPTTEPMAPTRLRYQRLMVTYGHYLYHILGVLLHSEWDLLTALNEHCDAGERSQMETSTAASANDGIVLSCATQAAEALQNVLSNDHELKFNPFLLGIFLVQGSYPLLVAASKDMQRASTQVLKACKITVRAHEASVATLHAEYQRKNRKLLLSAIEGIQYGPSAITREMTSLNERIIKLFRWSPGGRGLGL